MLLTSSVAGPRMAAPPGGHARGPQQFLGCGCVSCGWRGDPSSFWGAALCPAAGVGTGLCSAVISVSHTLSPLEVGIRQTPCDQPGGLRGPGPGTWKGFRAKCLGGQPSGARVGGLETGGHRLRCAHSVCLSRGPCWVLRSGVWVSLGFLSSFQWNASSGDIFQETHAGGMFPEHIYAYMTFICSHGYVSCLQTAWLRR